MARRRSLSSSQSTLAAIIVGGPPLGDVPWTNRLLAFGFFNAYGNPVRKDSVDYVIHLGDYIYEYKNGDYGWGNALGRVPQPDNEIHT